MKEPTVDQDNFKASRSFLSGKKWAEGDFATTEQINQLLEFADKDEHPPLTASLCDQIEASFNSLALSVIRYAKSEWGNDYFGAVASIQDLSAWLEFYEKKHGFGRHFKI